MGTIRGLECTLAYGENADGRCVWCGARLRARQTTWCSDACRAGFNENHCWTNARRYALTRARYACVRCALGPLHKPVEYDYGHDRELYETELAAFTAEVKDRRLEVNHKDPLVGAGYTLSCAHHQANLEVLCHFHHTGETRRQRRERAGMPTVEQLSLVAS